MKQGAGRVEHQHDDLEATACRVSKWSFAYVLSPNLNT